MPDSVPGVDLAVEPLRPVPTPPSESAAKVELGQALFFDPRLSSDNTVSCSSCHVLSQGGVDGKRFSTGVGGAVGVINAPTVYNSSLNMAQFWDGRAPTLEMQALGPVENPIEMAEHWPNVIAKLQKTDYYRDAFSELYRDGITKENVVDAIAGYERTLVTLDAPFDRWLRGDRNALTPLQQEGYQRFKDLGCASCHQGVNIGGNMYQKFGVMDDYFADRKLTSSDMGRFNVTRMDADRHVFKVPGLRNVALTAPYFHDGSAPTLEEAVTVMGRYQLGRELGPEDIRAITAFLQSLTGEYQGKPL